MSTTLTKQRTPGSWHVWCALGHSEPFLILRLNVCPTEILCPGHRISVPFLGHKTLSDSDSEALGCQRRVYAERKFNGKADAKREETKLLI